MPLGQSSLKIVAMETPTVQVASPTVMDDMGFDPESMLITLINQISTKLDTDRVFDQPVSEEVAPGYHDFIKRPMCFQRMREKVHGREYRTWRGFVEDFELICNNAMIYNQKRSRVHKSALSVLRAGKKWLQAAELAGRKAIAMLHPEGMAVAAAEEAREVQAAQQAAAAAARLKTPGISTRRTQLMSESPLTPRASMPCQRMAAMQTLACLAPPPDYSAGPLPDADDFQFDMHSDQEEGYSSFSDTDVEGAEGRTQASAPWLGTTAAAASYHAWPPGTRGPGAGRRQTRRPSSAKWRLRQIECRARFLQLRLWELSAQEEHFKAELQRLQEQEQQLATADASKAAGSAQPAPAHREPAATGAPAVATEAALKQEPAGDEGILSAASPSARLQAASAAAQPLSKASSMAAEPSMGPRRSQRRRKHERLQAAELVPATLLRHPMFAALAGVSNPAKVLEQTSIAESQREQETFPACAYAALEFCERHLGALRNQLKQVPGQRQRPQKKIIPSKGRGRGLAPANRPLQTRQRSGLGVLHSASKSGLERCSSYSKRRRNEYDMADILMSDAKYVERPKVANINIPPVRVKTGEQLENRQTEVLALKRRAAQHSPRLGCKGDSSSSEDTSDEAFLARHQPGWEEEHRRNYAPAAGIGQRRKTKEDKGKVSRPSSAKPFGSMDSLTVRVPSGSAVRSPPAAETPKAAGAAAQTPASAPAQLASSAPPDLVPAAAPLPPLGAATAAAVAAISKAGATPGSSPGAVAVTISAEDLQKDPSEALKPAVGKPGPSRPPGIKADRQNGRRITTRGLAVKAVAGRKPGRGRGRGRKGGRGRGSAANGSPHAHTNGAADSSSDEREASGSDAD